VVGNAVGNLKLLFSVKTIMKILKHTFFVATEKEYVHQYFRYQKELPPEHPNDTVWDGNKDMVIFPKPTAAPIHLESQSHQAI
jgi:hypothetical protein